MIVSRFFPIPQYLVSLFTVFHPPFLNLSDHGKDRFIVLISSSIYSSHALN